MTSPTLPHRGAAFAGGGCSSSKSTNYDSGYGNGAHLVVEPPLVYLYPPFNINPNVADLVVEPSTFCEQDLSFKVRVIQSPHVVVRVSPKEGRIAPGDRIKLEVSLDPVTDSRVLKDVASGKEDFKVRVFSIPTCRIPRHNQKWWEDYSNVEVQEQRVQFLLVRSFRQREDSEVATTAREMATKRQQKDERWNEWVTKKQDDDHSSANLSGQMQRKKQNENPRHLLAATGQRTKTEQNEMPTHPLLASGQRTDPRNQQHRGQHQVHRPEEDAMTCSFVGIGRGTDRKKNIGPVTVRDHRHANKFRLSSSQTKPVLVQEALEHHHSQYQVGPRPKELQYAKDGRRVHENEQRDFRRDYYEQPNYEDAVEQELLQDDSWSEPVKGPELNMMHMSMAEKMAKMAFHDNYCQADKDDEGSLEDHSDDELHLGSEAKPDDEYDYLDAVEHGLSGSQVNHRDRPVETLPAHHENIRDPLARSTPPPPMPPPPMKKAPTRQQFMTPPPPPPPRATGVKTGQPPDWIRAAEGAADLVRMVNLEDNRIEDKIIERSMNEVADVNKRTHYLGGFGDHLEEVRRLFSTDKVAAARMSQPMKKVNDRMEETIARLRGVRSEQVGDAK